MKTDHFSKYIEIFKKDLRPIMSNKLFQNLLLYSRYQLDNDDLEFGIQEHHQKM